MNTRPESKVDGQARYATDDAKWQAVVEKDRNADGKFYYSVKTTGVFCLASCPARSALRKNVAFHNTPKDAARADFRACKRREPDSLRPAAHDGNHFSRREMSGCQMEMDDLFGGAFASGAEVEKLAEGAMLFRCFVATEAVAIFQTVQQIVAVSPFRHMVTPGGHRMSVAMTNCGRVGWTTDRRGYRYDPLDPDTGTPWPAMPPALRQLAERAAARTDFPASIPTRVSSTATNPARGSRCTRIETRRVTTHR